jgi:Kef-type K+ transport system membrane component KefB
MDDDPGTTWLRRLAWLFGALSVLILVRVIALSEEGEVHAEVFVWFLLGCMAAVAAAACTVLVAVRRIAEKLTQSSTSEDAHS